MLNRNKVSYRPKTKSNITRLTRERCRPIRQ